MIDFIVRQLFKWRELRQALIEEVHMYDKLDRIMSDPDAMKIGSSFYPDVDGWRAWSFHKDKYYFNDIPEMNLMDAFMAMEEMELNGN
jgi:hypothetical protein